MSGKFIRFVLFLFFIPGDYISIANGITISGRNIEYSGRELEFFVYLERIFDTRESLAKTTADSTGFFSVHFSLEKTQCVYFQTPLYTAYIYAEPGRSYSVELPPVPPDEDGNRNNPFFRPPLWHAMPVDDAGKIQTGLNEAINSFDLRYEPFLDKQILRYYDPRQSREKLDSFINANSVLPDLNDSGYFEAYRNYKLATLGFLGSQFSHSGLYELYLKDHKARPDLPSWWEFFNFYFDGYFSSLAGRPGFSRLYSLMGSGNYHSLFMLLGNDSALLDEDIREWVLLKELHNAYYVNGLPLSSLTSLCDSMSASGRNPLTIRMAEKLKKDASSLVTGNLPPPAKLFTISGDSIDLSDLRGKYSYIGFCSLDNLGCQQEFEYLKYFYHKHAQYLDIIVILPAEEAGMIKDFTDQNSIPWEFWHVPANSTILTDYNVKAFPVFYLLDRDGKLVMSPAVLPSAGFEKHLFNILKARGEI